MNKEYNSYVFSGEPRWDKVKEERLSFWNWNSEAEYNTFFKMCFVKNKGIYLKMRTDEKNLRRECTNRDEPVYEDSCMEFFFSPVVGREEYFNLEMNPNSAYLCEYGKGKGDRVFLRELTEKQPEVKANITSEGWELDVFISCELISDAFKAEFTAEEGIYKGNFYKCGDKTEKIHYASFNEMSTLPPGFHNPERFAVINIRKE